MRQHPWIGERTARFTFVDSRAGRGALGTPIAAPLRRWRGGVGALFALAGLLVVGPARADLSDSAKSRAWSLEHGLYTDRCDPAKPIPVSVDDQDVGKCTSALESEAAALARFTEEEKKDPRIKALFASHAKFTAHVEKVKAAYDEVRKREANAERDVKAFRQEEKQNSDALWFLLTLEQKESIGKYLVQGTLESTMMKARKLGDLAARCKSTYAALKPRFSDGEFLSEPAQVCPVVMRRDATMKAVLPSAFSQLRAQAAERSKEIREKLATGEPIFAGDLPCGQDVKKCGDAETEIGRMASVFGVPSGSPQPASEAEFQAAMKTATSTVRMGGSSHDAAREGVMKAALKAARITPVRLALASANDVVVKEDGIPLRKSRGGRFLVKMPNESFCRAYEISVAASYQGGGRYGAFIASDVRIDDNNVKFIVSACK